VTLIDNEPDHFRHVVSLSARPRADRSRDSVYPTEVVVRYQTWSRQLRDGKSLIQL